jgi:hypothetical protein
MDYSNLRDKTIFDFTDDPVILEELVSTTDKDSFLKGLTTDGRVFSLLDYAEYIQDKEMIAAVEKEFELEIAAFFNE